MSNGETILGTGVGSERKINRKKRKPIIESTKDLAEELHKPVIRKLIKEKYTLHLKIMYGYEQIRDTRLLSKQNKRIKFILCAIDLFSKYAFVIAIKDKRGISIVNAFEKIIKQSNRKPNKIWVDQGGEFYNKKFKQWLSDNNIIMYSIFNEGKSVVAERLEH